MNIRLTSIEYDWSAVSIGAYHQEEIQKKHLRPGAREAGIKAVIGWRTFRHSYRSWLDKTDAPVGVQRELMRHASIRTTMNVYGRAMTDTKRQAHDKVGKMGQGNPQQKPPKQPLKWDNVGLGNVLGNR
jgi:hypothetical protein